MMKRHETNSMPINHPRDGYSGREYPEEIIREIYRLKDSGYPCKIIATTMELSYNAVCRYVRNRRAILLRLTKRKNELAAVKAKFGRKEI